MTGFLIGRVPPFPGEVVLCGHTAVQLGPRTAAASSSSAGRHGSLTLASESPLVVTAEAWRAVWRELDKQAGPAESRA